jgi:hypothetical protein
MLHICLYVYLFSTPHLDRCSKNHTWFHHQHNTVNNKTRRDATFLNVVTSSANNTIKTCKFGYIFSFKKKHYNHSLNKFFWDMKWLEKLKHVVARNSRKAFECKCFYTSTNRFIITLSIWTQPPSKHNKLDHHNNSYQWDFNHVLN